MSRTGASISLANGNVSRTLVTAFSLPRTSPSPWTLPSPRALPHLHPSPPPLSLKPPHLHPLPWTPSARPSLCRTHPPPDHPKFRAFFPLPLTYLFFFLSLSGSLIVELWSRVGGLLQTICAFELFWGHCVRAPDNDLREAQTHKLYGPWARPVATVPRQDPPREKKTTERDKKREILGASEFDSRSPPSGPPPPPRLLPS